MRARWKPNMKRMETTVEIWRPVRMWGASTSTGSPAGGGVSIGVDSTGAAAGSAGAASMGCTEDKVLLPKHRGHKSTERGAAFLQWRRK
jgi:hypothetical protein